MDNGTVIQIFISSAVIMALMGYWIYGLDVKLRLIIKMLGEKK